jgi:hypothetical protein
MMDPTDLLQQTLFPDNAWRHRTGPGLVIGARCDLHPVLREHATDRLDTEHLFVTIDVINDLGYRRSQLRDLIGCHPAPLVRIDLRLPNPRQQRLRSPDP